MSCLPVSSFFPAVLDVGRLQKEKSSKMGQLQQQALSRVEEKVNLSKMNIKEFRKEELIGCSKISRMIYSLYCR